MLHKGACFVAPFFRLRTPSSRGRCFHSNFLNWRCYMPSPFFGLFAHCSGHSKPLGGTLFLFCRLRIGFDNFFCDSSFGNTTVHCLFFDIPMRLRLVHMQFGNQQPFGTVDKPDFFHLFFDGQCAFLKSAQSLPRTCHPSERLQKRLLGNGLGKGKHTILRHPIICAVVQLCADQKKHGGAF